MNRSTVQLALFALLLSAALIVPVSKVFMALPAQSVYSHYTDTTVAQNQATFALPFQRTGHVLTVKHPGSGEGAAFTFNNTALTPFKTEAVDGPDTAAPPATVVHLRTPSDALQEANTLRITFAQASVPYVQMHISNVRHAFLRNTGFILVKPFPFPASGMAQTLMLFCSLWAGLLCLLGLWRACSARCRMASSILLALLALCITAAAWINSSPAMPYGLAIHPMWLLLLWLIGMLKISFGAVLNGAPQERLAMLNNTTTASVGGIVLGLAAILALFRLWAGATAILPMGHDTFQYLNIQYNAYFNEPILHGRLPEWFPFMTHGTLAYIWVAIAFNTLLAAIQPMIQFLQGINFTYLYQAALLFDELTLLLGTVLLARQTFRSQAAICFVSSAVVLTSISATQIWYDFRLIYLFPLVLFCLNNALKQCSARHVFLFCTFFVGMFYGALPYHPPLFIFVLLIYLLSKCIAEPGTLKDAYKSLHKEWGWKHLLAIGIPAGFGWALFRLLKRGTEEIVSFNQGRDSQFVTSSLEQFLNYGGYIDFEKYWEFFTRHSNNIDNTVYAGLLIMPFAVLTLLRRRTRPSAVFGLAALLMLLFSAGLLIPYIFYGLIPFAKYFRHIGLATPLAKLFLIFYAGFGFELFWHSLKSFKDPPKGRWLSAERTNILIPALVMLCALSIIFAQRTTHFPFITFRPWGPPTANQLYLTGPQIMAGLNSLTVMYGLYMLVFVLIATLPRRAKMLGLILLSLHLLDVGTFKYEREYQATPRVEQDVLNLYTVHDYAFPERRSQEYFANERYARLAPTIFYDELPFDTYAARLPVARYGVVYWDLETFLFHDAVSSIFRARHFIEGSGDFMHAWFKEGAIDRSRFGFPIPSSEAFNKLSGVNAPKLQLFSQLHRLESNEAIAQALAAPSFNGNIIFAAGPDVSGQTNFEGTHNSRVEGAVINVEDYSFNQITVSVDNPLSTAAFLYYADTWHPRWKVRVNGEAKPIIKTNLGYKSITVPPGKSSVAFAFGDTESRILLMALPLMGLVLLGSILFVFIKDICLCPAHRR